jgi:H+/Cl- antiporter ClcA
MKNALSYRLLFRLAVVGSIVSFLRCIALGFYSMATSLGGHGQEAVLESAKDGNKAELWFFLSMALVVVAVALLYAINKVEAKNSGQKE